MRLFIIIWFLCQAVPSDLFIVTSTRLSQRNAHLPSDRNVAKVFMVATVPSDVKTNVRIDEANSRELSSSVSEASGKSTSLRVVQLYDTTLRDGTQMEGVSASVNDKLKIARELHKFGM